MEYNPGIAYTAPALLAQGLRDFGQGAGAGLAALEQRSKAAKSLRSYLEAVQPEAKGTLDHLDLGTLEGMAKGYQAQKEAALQKSQLEEYAARTAASQAATALSAYELGRAQRNEPFDRQSRLAEFERANAATAADRFRLQQEQQAAERAAQQRAAAAKFYQAIGTGQVTPEGVSKALGETGYEPRAADASLLADFARLARENRRANPTPETYKADGWIYTTINGQTFRNPDPAVQRTPRPPRTFIDPQTKGVFYWDEQHQTVKPLYGPAGNPLMAPAIDAISGAAGGAPKTNPLELPIEQDYFGH